MIFKRQGKPGERPRTKRRGIAVTLMAAVALSLTGGVQFTRAAAPPASLPASDADLALYKKGTDHFYNLEYDQAIAAFEKLRDAAPDNPSRQNDVATAYFYKQLYLAGVLQGDLFNSSNKFFRTRKIQMDPAITNAFWEANDAAIRICQQRLKSNEADEEALYSCGVAYATRSTYQGLIERSKFGFLSNARKGNDYHARLIRLNPRYYDAYLIPGLLDFVLGSLPKSLKVLLYLAGLSGDKQRGMQAVKSVTEWGQEAKEAAKILLTIMYRREKRHADARRVVQDLAELFPRNYMLPLEIASIYRSAEEYDEAIRGYEQVLERVRQQQPGYADAPVARIHYELGELYRNEDDLESALRHLERVPGSKGSTPEMEEESALLRQQIEATLQQQEQAARGDGNAGKDSARSVAVN